MAGKPKLSTKELEAIKGAESQIKQAVDVSGAEAVAQALGKTTKFVESVVKKGLSTTTGRSLIEGIKDLDDKLLKLRTPTAKPSQPSPALSELSRALGEFEPKSPPPSVPDLYKKQYTNQMGDESAALQVKGGPVVPVQTRSLGRVRGYLDNQVVDPVTKAPISSETAVVPYGPVREEPIFAKEGAAYAEKAKPGPSVSELTPEAKTKRGEESRVQAERAADLGLDLDLSLTPSAQTMKKAALGVGGAAALAAGAAGVKYGLGLSLDSSTLPEAEKKKLPALTATDTKTPDQLKQSVDKTLEQQAIDQDKGETLKQNTEMVAQAAKSIEDTIREDYKKDRARLELFQALDTIANGFASALGSYALRNSGSPYAIDFSKGPQVNWDAQFDRLQKDFNTQMSAITAKYKLEERRKEKEEERAFRRELQQEELAAKERMETAKEEKKRLEEQAKEVKKLNADQQKQYKENLKNYGDLRRAIVDKKPGAVEDAAILLGAEPATIEQLNEAMNQGLWDKLLTTLGISEQPTVEQVLQGLRPVKPQPATAPAAKAAPAVQLPSALVVRDDKGNVVQKIQRPPNATDEKWKAYIDSISAQNKNVAKEF